MGSTFFTILAVAITATYILAVAGVEIHDSSKCKPSPEGIKQEMPLRKECYREVTGKEVNVTNPAVNLTKDEKLHICVCMARKQGVVSEDLSDFDVALAQKSLEDIEANAETKALLIGGFDECGELSNDGVSFIKCLKDVFEEVCKA